MGTRSGRTDVETTALRERISELERNEHRFHSTLDSMIEGCQILGHDWRYLYVNPAAERHNRRPTSELLGRRYADMWRGIEATEVHEKIRRCLEDRVPDAMENAFVFPDGGTGWFDLRFEPVPEGVLILSSDVSVKKTSEQRSQRLAQLLGAIRQVNQLIVRVKEPGALAQQTCDVLVRGGRFGAAWIALHEPDGSGPAVFQSGFGAAADVFRARLTEGWRPDCWHPARATEGVYAIRDPRQTCRACPLWASDALAESIVAPLRHEGVDFGTLGICMQPGAVGDDDQLALVSEVADDLGLALHGMHNERRRAAMAQILSGSDEAMALVSRDHVMLEVNPKYAYYWGREPAEVVGRHATEIVGREFFEKTARAQIDACFDGVTTVAEAVREVPGLGRVHAEVRYAPSLAADGTITAAAVTIRDVTGLKDTQAKLRGSEDRLAVLFHRSPVAIVLTRMMDGMILDANAAFARLYGYPLEELVGRRSPDLGLWAVPAERRELMRRLAEDGICRDLEMQARLKDGSIRTLRTTVERIEVEGEMCSLGVLQDVTEQRATENALRDRERLLSEMGASAKVGGWVFDPATGQGSWTEEVARIHDVEPEAWVGVAKGIGYYHGVSRERIEAAVRAAVEEAKPYDLVLELVSEKGAHKWVRTIAHPVVEDGKVVKVWGSLQDVTEQKRAESAREKLEEQLRVSQKMEAIGTLAGGVAHDFNNLLVVILNYADFALEALNENDPLHHDILEVRRAGERAATLTRQLLAFSRRQVLQPVPLNLDLVVEGLEKMLRRIVGEDIEFVLDLHAADATVVADPGQTEQVLMNLVVNARDAMPEGGRLVIATSTIDIGPGVVREGVEVLPGPYVELRVADEGSGMTPDTRARIFEPFFTTKPTGRGTGLGLAMAYGIVKQSGGYIWAESEPGRGTRMRIHLPRVLEAPLAAIAAPTPARRPGSETILLVEDEEALRDLVRRMLRAAGYEVLTAADGEEALGVVARHGGEVRLLLTDVVMPRAGGTRVAREFAKAWPRVKVLYMSGYTDEAIAKHGVVDAAAPLLVKPFTSQELLRKVREVLDGAVPGA